MNADLFKNSIRDQRAELLFAAAGMGAVGDQDRHLLRRQTAIHQQIFDEMGDHQILPHPEPGHVAHHQHDRLVPVNARSQGRASDGLLHTFSDRGANVGKSGYVIAKQLLLHPFLIQGDRHAPASICK